MEPKKSVIIEDDQSKNTTQQDVEVRNSMEFVRSLILDMPLQNYKDTGEETK